MSDGSISRLRQMAKEELIKQILSLRLETKELFGRLLKSEDQFRVAKL